MGKRLILALMGVGLIVAVAAGLMAPGDKVGAEIGQTLPEYGAFNLEGEEVTFADLEGQVALITVWATWCGPCRIEMPSIQSVYERYKDEGFTVLAISIDTDPSYEAKIRDFFAEHELTFEAVVDPANEITRLLSTIGVPENFVVDKNGRVVKRVIGASNWDSEANRALIEELLRM